MFNKLVKIVTKNETNEFNPYAVVFYDICCLLTMFLPYKHTAPPLECCAEKNKMQQNYSLENFLCFNLLEEKNYGRAINHPYNKGREQQSFLPEQTIRKIA